MVHIVSKNYLKVMGLSANLLGVLILLSYFIPRAAAFIPDNIRITNPENGFHVNHLTAAAFPVSGWANAGNNITLFGNGLQLASAPADANGHFSLTLDLSSFIEGPLTLLILQEGIRSIPVSGTYDATPPRITEAIIDDRTITIVFNESNLQYVRQEANYRFSPSLNFKTAGGSDDITRIDDFSFQLFMRSIPSHEIIRLTLSNITDAAGNAVASMPVMLNDRDRDRMADSWEAQQGLNPLIADASLDEDNDGFSNYQEFMARSNPYGILSAPIEIRDTIPQDDAGIANFARVPDQTAVAVLLHSAHGIDTDAFAAVRFLIDDGYHQPYWRDLGADAVRAVKLGDAPGSPANDLWVTYDRCLEPFMPTSYRPDAVVQVWVTARDIRNNNLPPASFEFKIESEAQKVASRQKVPTIAVGYDGERLPGDGRDTGIAVVAGKPAGARLFYSPLEPLTPQFGNPDEMPSLGTTDMQAAGVPVNLLPHTVFDRPVSLFIPVAETMDLQIVGLAYFDGIEWLPAVDADGRVLSGGEGWVVPDSRINHEESSPPLIEVQVYHFSAAQAVVFARFGDPADEDEDKPPSNGNNADVYISCFIDSVSADTSFDFTGLISLVALVGVLLLVKRFKCLD